MAKRIKSPAVTAPVPQSDDQARAQIREIGDIERQIERAASEANDKIAKVQEALGNSTAPLSASLTALKAGLQTYCEANRHRLTQGGKVKSYNFVTGEVQWRKKPPSVKLKGVADVVERLKKSAALRRFLRVKEEVNKEALLAKPEIATTIEGVTIVTDVEEFIITPAETELAEAG